jgi:hypothetical protein
MFVRKRLWVPGIQVPPTPYVGQCCSHSKTRGLFCAFVAIIVEKQKMARNKTGKRRSFRHFILLHFHL